MGGPRPMGAPRPGLIPNPMGPMGPMMVGPGPMQPVGMPGKLLRTKPTITFLFSFQI